MEFEYIQQEANARQIELEAPASRFRREWHTRQEVERASDALRLGLARLGESPTFSGA